MIKEYVILGVVLVVMGAAQIWLRFGPWGKEQRAAEETVAKRRQEAARVSSEAGLGDEAGEESDLPEKKPVYTERGSKLWTKWTAILGPLGIVFGLTLLVLGLIGE